MGRRAPISSIGSRNLIDARQLLVMSNQPTKFREERNEGRRHGIRYCVAHLSGACRSKSCWKSLCAPAHCIDPARRSLSMGDGTTRQWAAARPWATGMASGGVWHTCWESAAQARGRVGRKATSCIDLMPSERAACADDKPLENEALRRKSETVRDRSNGRTGRRWDRWRRTSRSF